MSRIHDALKRAEQERATSMGGHVEPALGQPEPQPISMPEHVQATTAVMPSMPGSGFSYETLLAQCPLSNWAPDSRTMLFFQEDENRRGAEEFRTLRSRLYQIREKLPLKRLMVTSALPPDETERPAPNPRRSLPLTTPPEATNSWLLAETTVSIAEAPARTS